jgi:hypothetical protein
MTMRRFIRLVLALSTIAAGLAACGSPAPQPPGGPGVTSTARAPAAIGAAPLPTAEKINVEVGPNDPQIFMLEPQDGSVVDSPFFLRVGVSNFVIPISDLKIHVAVDAACTPAGQVIPPMRSTSACRKASQRMRALVCRRASIACAFRLPTRRTSRWQGRA